jgi:hypothetical protein
MNRKLTTLLAAAALSILPAATFADHHDDHVDVRGGIGLNLNFGNPVVEERTTQVWVEPAYHTVTDRVWCPPVTQNVTQRIWITDGFETRDVIRYERGRRIIVRENVLVTPGHYEDRVAQVEVTPGHYEDVQRQECVTPGHYETRVAEIEHHDSLAVRFPIHW